MGNCGLYVDVPPGSREVGTHAVLLPLAVLGGLGITVVIELWDAVMHKRGLSRHARVVLRMTAGLYLAGLVGLVVLQMVAVEAPSGGRGPAGPAASVPWGTALANASATSVNARTAGLAMLPVYSFPRAMVVLVMVLMVVGASPGGTGGGLKTTTVYELFMGVVRALRGEGVSRVFGVAAVWVGVYLVSVVLFYMMLLTSEPQMPGDRALFVIVSAVSNVGLSHDTLSMTRSSLYVVSAAMFAGRLAPLLVLWWMADTTREVAVG
jgi:trk system potassium uptake protein TrkH